MSDPHALIEIYATHNLVNAQILIDLFKDRGLVCTTRTLQPGQFPLNMGDHGEHRISVEESQIAHALRLIQQAVDDGAILAADADLLVAMTDLD